MSKSKNQLKILVQVALLVAIEVVLSRWFSIATPFVKIGFAFVPLAICGTLFGPVWACAAGGVADFLGANLFPIGPYFPGFTLSAMLTGVVFGLCLHRKEIKWGHIVVAVAVNHLVISLFLTTFWIHLLYGAPYLQLLATRVLQNAIMIPIEFAVLRLIQKPIVHYAAYAQLT